MRFDKRRQRTAEKRCEGKYIELGKAIGAVKGAFEFEVESPDNYRDIAVETLKLLPSVEAVPSADIAPRWIPVTERLPEEPFGCLVTVWDTNPISMDEFENLLPYFVGWDGEQWNDGDGIQCPFEVVAWMPLPEPYKEGEQNE